MPDRQITLRFDPLDTLVARRRPDNPKGHDRKAIEESVQRAGYITPVVVNDEDGLVLAGHGRIDALERIRGEGQPPPPGIRVADDGDWLVPAIHGVKLNKDDARAFVVADNRTVELGGWDDRRLAEMLLELDQSEQGLAGTGFTDVDLDTIVSGLLQGVDRKAPRHDEAPPLPGPSTVYVRRGDRFTLGRHSVLCGDSRDSELLLRTTGVDEVRCLVTDPPFGVGYEGGTKDKLTIRGDDPDGIGRLLGDVFGAIDPLLAPGTALYVFHPAGPLSLIFGQAFLDRGWQLRQTLIWLKDSLVLGRSDYHYRHEPILYGLKPGAGRRGRGSRHWHGGNDASSVLEFPRPKASHEHPTMKPVPLLELLLRNSSDRGDVVLDPFLGSGSTLIAAERLGRRCVGIELDPRYAQVAIERWQRFTGREAILEGRS